MVLAIGLDCASSSLMVPVKGVLVGWLVVVEVFFFVESRGGESWFLVVCAAVVVKSVMVVVVVVVVVVGLVAVVAVVIFGWCSGESVALRHKFLIRLRKKAKKICAALTSYISKLGLA